VGVREAAWVRSGGLQGPYMLLMPMPSSLTAESALLKPHRVTWGQDM